MNEPVDWYLIFVDTEPTPWPRARALLTGAGWLTVAQRLWRVFTRPGFRHVWCLRNDGFNWLCINYRDDGLDVWIAPELPSDPLPQRYVRAGARVFHVKHDREPVFLPRGIGSCVMLSKQLLGLRSCFWVLTPFQLYRFLRSRTRRGLEVVEVDGGPTEEGTGINGDWLVP